MSEVLLSWLLAAQGAMGAIDTLVNHEFIEALPHRRAARAEIGLHAIREAIYATLFGALAWFAWHGAAAWVIVALLAGEVLITVWDEWVENRIRVLPQNERVLHIFLTLNFGAIIVLLVPVLGEWMALPTRVAAVERGAVAWLITAFALGSAAWTVRDFLAWRRLN